MEPSIILNRVYALHLRDSPRCEEAAIIDVECWNCGWRAPLHTDKCAYVERGEPCDCGYSDGGEAK